MRRSWPVVVCAAVMAVGCSGSGGSSPPQPPVSLSPNPHHGQLVRRADLDPCPTSGSSTTSGGLPDVTLPCLGAGPAVRLAALSGAPTVVNIWGSWCGPCQKETRFFAQAYDRLKTEVRFLGVDDEDDPNSALDFAAHVNPPMRYPSVVDDDKKVLVAMNTSEVPITVFVDRSGRIVHRNFGPYRNLATLRADIAHYLGVTG